MSAPMYRNISVSKKTLKYHIFGNISLITTALCLVIIPFNSKSSLDIVTNVLTSTKVNSFLMVVFHLTFHLILTNISSNYTFTKFSVKNVLRLCFLCITSIFMFHTIAVLYGAAFFENTTETFHFALLLTCETSVPIFIHLGISTDSWIKVFIFNNPDPGTESLVYASTIGSLVGAWVGAFPIPLDWDRPWQKWPVSCVIGALVGHCIGLMINCVYIFVYHYRTNKFKLF